MGKFKPSSYGDDIPKQEYFLSMLHVSDNGQAKPAVYEIQKEDNRYFIVEAFKRLYIGYDAVKDSISIFYYGEYLRNWQVYVCQSFKRIINQYNDIAIWNW